MHRPGQFVWKLNYVTDITPKNITDQISFPLISSEIIIFIFMEASSEIILVQSR